MSCSVPACPKKKPVGSSPLIALAFAIACLYPSQGKAWGWKGHELVAEIAKSCLEKQVVDSVQYFLGKTSFGEAATWMDEIKGDHAFDSLKPMHYINVERDKTYVKTEGANIVNELELVIAQLLKKEPRDKKDTELYLKILFHLVGDIHQPLHVGYGADKGGNTIDVDFLGKDTNLHHVWDSDIIELTHISLNGCLKLANTLSKQEVQNLQKIDVQAWMDDSRALLPEVYNFQDHLITQPYIDTNKEVIKKQLLKGGIRLAAVLHRAFHR